MNTALYSVLLLTSLTLGSGDCEEHSVYRSESGFEVAIAQENATDFPRIDFPREQERHRDVLIPIVLIVREQLLFQLSVNGQPLSAEFVSEDARDQFLDFFRSENLEKLDIGTVIRCDCDFEIAIRNGASYILVHDFDFLLFRNYEEFLAGVPGTVY